MREDMFSNQDIPLETAKIIVAGVGGAGGNAVKYMLEEKIGGVEFVCINTDIKDLSKVEGAKRIAIGKNLTRGLGAGGDPVRGREAAIENKEDIYLTLEGCDMVFITAGMGGGTGTGAAPIVAELAKELGILTVGVVTKPFGYEGSKRQECAEQGLECLKHHVDSLIVLPNDKLLEHYGAASLLNAFGAINNVLLNAVRGIAELITKPGLINVDFADVRAVMSEMGISMMGSGYSDEENAAIKAVEQAMASPLLENIALENAKGMLVNVTGDKTLTVQELNQIGERLKECTTNDAKMIMGTSIDQSMQKAIRVTIVAAGLEKESNRLQAAGYPPEKIQVAREEDTVDPREFLHDQMRKKFSG